MKPEEIQRLAEVERKLDELISMLSSAPAFDHSTARAIGIIAERYNLRPSTANPTSYDVTVNEAGASSYTVADVPDGFYETADGNLIPYYTP